MDVCKMALCYWNVFKYMVVFPLFICLLIFCFLFLSYLDFSLFVVYTVVLLLGYPRYFPHVFGRTLYLALFFSDIYLALLNTIYLCNRETSLFSTETSSYSCINFLY